MPNGLGPYWFPSAWRAGLTRVSSLYFDECNWSKHDEGYERGAPNRATCDRLMLAACLRDSSRTTTIPRMLACTALSWAFWALVRCFGWASWHFPNNQTIPISEDMNIMTDTKFTEASEPEMVKRNSASMKRLEAIWGEVIRRMDSRMDDSGTCPNAHGLCDAEDIRASLTILHRKMDKFAATHGNVPIARSGER